MIIIPKSLVWNFKKVLEKDNPDTAAAALVHSSCKYHSHSGIRQGSCLSAYEPAQLQQKWFVSKVADPQNYPQKITKISGVNWKYKTLLHFFQPISLNPSKNARLASLLHFSLLDQSL